MDKYTKSVIADVLFSFSIIAALLAAWSYFYGDIWLASTQWVLLATILGVYAIYVEVKQTSKK